MIGHGAGIAFGHEFFNPATPVSVPVAGFNPGQTLRVVLIPTGTDRFVINLRTPDDIAFHFNARFDENAVVRNSTRHGHWQNEERWDQEFPFHAGRIYTVEFQAHPGRVAILINGRPYCEFNERDNHGAVHLIEIDGNIHVHNVQVKL
ncbi:unnamed protein product, partial [Mesorhabditis belari]|uniref:Galectin n=1 Tax=Mesorhabditis belari TaxID=2138241 RepID=A0AAF3EAY1_9BILA